jgi:hypothetical protein
MQHQKRRPPDGPAFHGAARDNPGGWVYDIDWTYGPRSRVPPEAIRGGWRVDVEGRLTDEWTPNPRYRPVERLSRTPARYMLAAARHLRDELMDEIAPGAERLFTDIPEDHKVGSWYVAAKAA